jgi:monofunctional biosynthetic peptidoglycan transglycosylase
MRRKRGGVRRLGIIIVACVLALPVALVLLTLLFALVTPPSTLMLGRYVTGAPVDRTSVPLSAISPHLRIAVIASEDQRFCAHRGVDWDALREVIEDEEGPSRGASTISMQTAKNVFLWPGRSYIRKGLEIPVALLADLIWGKRRMLEIYLNVAEWGEGVYGAQAAARKHFRKDAKDLTRAEAALLAAALPNPILRNAGRPTRGVQAIARRITVRMAAAEPLATCVLGRG